MFQSQELGNYQRAIDLLSEMRDLARDGGLAREEFAAAERVGVIFALIENHQAAAKALEDTLKLSTCPRRFPAQSPSPHGVTVNQESETSKKSFLFFSIFARESGRRVCIVDREHGTKVKAQTLQPCAGCETRGRVLLLTIPTHVRAQAPHFAVSIRDHFLSDVSV